MAYGTNGWYGQGGYLTPPSAAAQAQPTAPSQVMILVNSEQEAMNWSVLPGNSVFFMDSNNKLFYIKSVDLSGIPSFKKYKFEEVVETKYDSRDYISREEFEEFKKKFNKSNFQPRKGDKIDG